MNRFPKNEFPRKVECNVITIAGGYHQTKESADIFLLNVGAVGNFLFSCGKRQRRGQKCRAPCFQFRALMSFLDGWACIPCLLGDYSSKLMYSNNLRHFQIRGIEEHI